MKMTDKTLDHLKRWEGLRLTAYPDPGSKDGTPWTIGHGHTSDAFMRVYKGPTITKEQANAAPRHGAQEALDAVARLVVGHLMPGMVDAYISLAEFKAKSPRTQDDYRKWALRFAAEFKDDPVAIFEEPAWRAK